MSMTINRILPWALAAWIAYVFVWYLQYKFTGHEGSVWLFTVITDWLGLKGHEKAMRIGVGSAELTGKLQALDTPSRLKAQAPGGTMIELILDGEAQRLAEKMSAVDGIRRLEPRGNVLRVYADRPADAVPALFRAAQDAQYEVRDVHLAAPSLETLFIALTGRKLE